MRSESARQQQHLPGGLSVALAMLGALLLSAYSYRHRLLLAISDPTQWADDPVPKSDLFRQLGTDALLAVSISALMWLVILVLQPLGRSAWLRRSGLLGLSALLAALGNAAAGPTRDAAGDAVRIDSGASARVAGPSGDS